ncbi:VOC family protein, partial [Pseudoalteromonas sp. 2102]|nr:VOC family protein [Pseudoalteromonas sp. 2102]
MTFSIIRCARAVLHVTDLAAARDFYERVLGFVVTEADESHLYLRGLEEYHHHSLLLKKAPRPAVEALGYKVGSERELEALYEWFAAQTLQPKWLEDGSQRAVGRAFRVQDPSGLPLEFFAHMEKT